MKPLTISIYDQSATLPTISDSNYFHSRELMLLCEATPRHHPYMAVATTADGHVVAHMLAVVRRRRWWLPPFISQSAWLMGEGVYESDAWPREEVFEMMLRALGNRLRGRILFFEVTGLSRKMFGYGALRRLGFFPVRWMAVGNSLHSHSPEERISPRLLRRIKASRSRGAVSKIVETEEEFRGFFRLLCRHNWNKPRHYIPHERFFRDMMASGRCRIYITVFRGHVIGGAVCIFAGHDAYLWQSAARRKSFAPLYPHAVTIWEALTDAYTSGYDHMYFLDVGMPFRKDSFRESILRFGGREASTYRWFRISLPWLNRIASWLWRF